MSRSYDYFVESGAGKEREEEKCRMAGFGDQAEFTLRGAEFELLM